MHLIRTILPTLLILFYSAPIYPFFNEWSDFNKRMRKEFWEGLQTRKDDISNRIQTLTEDTHDTNEAPASRGHKPPTLTLADIKGVVPQEIYDLKDFIQGAAHFIQAGATPPKGILLIGAPGTGKTSIARALAAEVDAIFITAAGSEFVEMYVGVGASRIRELFAKARKALKDNKTKHVIIFIDEIDAIGCRDNSPYHSSEDNKTIDQLLTEMDGFTKENRITVIAATNRLELVDKALRRPGRFDYIIEIPLPDEKTRREILEFYLYDPKFGRSTSGTIDLESIARKTHDFSGAELESIIKQATIVTARARRTAITQEDLDHAYLQARKSHQARK
ncbi:MAG: ATP-binding protein [Candidatus Babeliales bacterium]